MSDFIFVLIMTVFGFWSTWFGIMLLFDKKFLSKLENGVWKEGKNSMFSKIGAHNYNKFGRGIPLVATGVVFIYFGIRSLFGI